MPTPPEADPPSRATEWSYLLGIGGYSILDTFLQTWLIFFFAPPPDKGVGLVDPQTYGLAVLVGRFIEAIANPSAGFGADRTGRPWLFLLTGALLANLASLALFFGPVVGDSLRNTTLLFVLLPIALFGQALYIVPYLGLLPRIARQDVRRVRMTNSQALLILIGVLIGQVLSGVAFKLLDRNLLGMALLFLSLAVSLMLLPVPAVRTFKTRADPFSPTEALAILRRNPGFRVIVIAQGFFWLGFNMVRYAALYYVTVLLREPEEKVALYLGSIFLVTVPSLVLIRFLVPRVGKRRMMMLATGLFALLLPLLSTIGHPVWFMSASVWAVGVFALTGFPLAILSAVPNPMIAEQIDQDALLSGVPKGALFFGVQGVVIKTSSGLAGALLGFLLGNFGYSQANPFGIQLVGPLAGILALAAAIAYSFYPRTVFSREKPGSSAG